MGTKRTPRIRRCRSAGVAPLTGMRPPGCFGGDQVLYQSKMRLVSAAQPLIGACSLLAIAVGFERTINGTTAWSLQTMSLRRTSIAARLTGSSSLSAARNRRSYSSLRQRVTLRPSHLLALEAISHEQ